MKTANRKRWVDIPLARKVLIAVGSISVLLSADRFPSVFSGKQDHQEDGYGYIPATLT